MKALIVEDELLARVGMRSLLPWEELGIALLEDACDGREALQQIESGHPDLMFLDLNIPIRKIKSFLQQLRLSTLK